MTSEELDRYRPVDADARQQRRDDYAAMGYARWEIDDLDTMHDLLARLRACAVARVEACEKMMLPQNGLEMQRQARALRATADLVVDLHSPAPRRTRKAPVRTTPPSMPRPANSDPDTLPPPKPARPAKPEPSPFMKGMDEIEHQLKQIVSVAKAMNDLPNGAAVTPALYDALVKVDAMSHDPDLPADDRTIALATLAKETRLATARHKLGAATGMTMDMSRGMGTGTGKGIDTAIPPEFAGLSHDDQLATLYARIATFAQARAGRFADTPTAPKPPPSPPDSS